MPSTNTAPQPCASPRLCASVRNYHLKARYTVSHPHTVSCQERTCDVSIPSYMYTVSCPGSLCASHCSSKWLSVLPEICPNTGGVFSPALNRSIAVTVQPENVERNQLCGALIVAVSLSTASHTVTRSIHTTIRLYYRQVGFEPYGLNPMV